MRSNVIRHATRILAASSAEIGISRGVSHEKDVSLFCTVNERKQNCLNKYLLYQRQR